MQQVQRLPEAGVIKKKRRPRRSRCKGAKIVAPSIPVMVAVTAAAPADNRSRPVSSDSKTLRILLVEDHADTARAMRRLLAGEGHSVTIAATMRESLRIISEQVLDLVICDIGLPDGSGYDIPRLMTPLQPTPAIALSAHVSDEDYKLSRESGFRAHVAKPVDFHQLTNLIRALAK